MVEELAKVKTLLAQKNAALTTSQKALLSTFERIRLDLSETYQNLKFLSNVQEAGLKGSNVLDLTSECLNLSQQLVLNSGIPGMPMRHATNQLDNLTEAEKSAMNALTMKGSYEAATDDAFKAVCSQAQLEYHREKSQSENDLEVVNKEIS